MGFGIATLGYGFLLTYEAGGGIIAGILLAYGFFLASGVNRRFLYASISSLFMIPHSVLLLIGVANIFDMGKVPYLHEISYTIFLLSWLTMSYYYLTAVKEIAVENKNIKLSNKASNRLYLTAIVIFAVLSTMFFSFKDFTGRAFIFILIYSMIIINILFLHNCFLMITTERQYKKDKIMIAEEDKKVLERRNKKK